MDRPTVTGYFIAPDAWDADWLWRERGDYPVPVLSKHELRDDPDVWAVLVEWADVAPSESA